ncbi:MAG: radical SAM protein [Nitrospirota bacterium]
MLSQKYSQVSWLNYYRKQLKNKTLRPYYVQWIATHECNFKCPNCGGGAKIPQKDELSTDEIIHAIDDLASLGCRFLSAAGGEAILRKDIFKVLKYAKNKGILVGIITNGYAIKEYAKQIEELNLDSVVVSIDGYGENHDRIRNMPGSYQKCLESLDFFYKVGIPIIGTYTVTSEENIADIPMIVDDVQKFGSTRHGLQLIIPEGRAGKKKNSSLLVKKILRLILSTKKRNFSLEASEGLGCLGPLEGKARPYYFFCGCGWNTFTIMANGNIMGCPLFDFPNYSEENIRRESLIDIWRNRFSRFREKDFEDLPEKCTACGYITLCRGGCWQFRATAGEFCFLDEAEEVAMEFGIDAG